MTSTLDPQSALVYTMVIMSAVDEGMSDQEMLLIGQTARMLAAFEGYDEERLVPDAEACGEILSADEGLETALDLIAEALPDPLCETAYGLACDIAASDGRVAQSEMRLLEMLRHRLNVGRLPAAAIERGARARWRRL